MEHAGRFAHQLDAAMGHHTLSSASEADRITVFRTLSVLIGAAMKRYAEWASVDPAEVISGGQNDGAFRWRSGLQDYIDVDERLCGQCDIATFARRFLLNANIEAFRRVERQGIVYAANRASTPWQPDLADVVATPLEDGYDELDAYYAGALAHYDTIVGPADHA